MLPALQPHQGRPGDLRARLADAEAAGRAVLAGDVSGVPKDQDGPVEAMHALRVAQRSAERARTQATNQYRSLLDTAPAQLREQLRGLGLRQMVDRASRFRPGKALSDPTAATKAASPIRSRKGGIVITISLSR